MDLKQRIKKTFIELIQINEIYPDEKEVIEYVTSRFNGGGVSWQLDSFRNIIIKIPGTGEPVLLSTHLDVPEPNPNVQYSDEGDILRADGTNILGADPKTGLAILIELAIDYVKKDHATHAPIELLLTRGEETGLHGARNADYSLLQAKIGLVLDEDGPVTQVVTQAPSFVKIDASFIGKIVHPREPEKGINALQVACESLMSLPWGYSTEGVTWNVGMFQAGTARNSVPGKAILKAELRSYDIELVKIEAARVEEIFRKVSEKYGATLEIENAFEFEGYKLETNHPLFVRLEKTFTAMNLTPNYFKTFGGTDANIFNTKGILSVPIGSGYYNAHEYTEIANVRDMEEIYYFLERFVVV
jgi:tripeptide aminopeptidase